LKEEEDSESSSVSDKNMVKFSGCSALLPLRYILLLVD
jgi:hypothetical protein